jgi:hypothetical protein
VLAVSGGGMIIGFACKKQVGKSTAAGWLVEAGFIRSSFAEPMKEMAVSMLVGMGLSFDEVMFFMQYKEERMPLLGVSMRHLLQTLGTDWGRQLIHPDVWVMAAARRIEDQLNQGRDVVIEDVRFENEAAFIRDHGGLVVHIERETGYSDGHESESGVRFLPGDWLISNYHLTLDAYRAAVLGLAGVDSNPLPPLIDNDGKTHAN